MSARRRLGGAAVVGFVLLAGCTGSATDGAGGSSAGQFDGVGDDQTTPVTDGPSDQPGSSPGDHVDPANGVITGRVAERKPGSPGTSAPAAAGVVVEVRQDGAVVGTTRTRPDGTYRLAVPVGDAVVYARASPDAPAKDARSVTVTADDPVDVDLVMQLRRRSPPVSNGR